MADVTRIQILSIYKALMRESQKLSAYNFRSYAVRRIRDSFKQNKLLEDVYKKEEQLQKAKQNLQILKRQAAISQMYSVDKLVIEHHQK